MTDPTEYVPLESLPTKHPFEPAPDTDTCLRCGFDFDFGALHEASEPEPEPLLPHDFAPDDIVQGGTGSLFLVEADRYNKSLRFVPLLPIAESQPNPPAGAVRVARRTA